MPLQAIKNFDNEGAEHGNERIAHSIWGLWKTAGARQATNLGTVHSIACGEQRRLMADLTRWVSLYSLFDRARNRVIV